MDIGCYIVCSILRVIVLIVFRSFHLYLLLQLIQSVASNVILACYCDKHYSFVKEKTNEKFTDVKGMLNDMKNLLLGKVAGYVYSCTDNLVISTFIGVSVAGGFSTYRYVTNAVKNLMHNTTDSITATLGNNVQTREVEANYEVLRKYSFVRFVVGNVLVTGLCMCTDAFVGVAFGKEYIISHWVLYFICADMFVGIVYGPLNEYINVLGYFDMEKYINLGGAAINIALSILLVQKMGIVGVLIGTVASQVFFMVAKSILLFRRYFKSHEKLREMLGVYAGYIVVVLLQNIALHFLKNILFFEKYTLVVFLVEGCISVLVSCICVCVLYRKTEQFEFLYSIVKNIIGKFTKKQAK